MHPGRGHTAGDLVVRVPDADVVLAGDLVEESERQRARLRRRLLPAWSGRSPSTSCSACPPRRRVVVPGHGAVVDREFVEEQRNDIGIVAETIRDLATRGVRLDDALAAAEWPYPREPLAAPYAAGTNTCRAARSACRSSERSRAGWWGYPVDRVSLTFAWVATLTERQERPRSSVRRGVGPVTEAGRPGP